MCPLCEHFAEWLYTCAHPECTQRMCSNCKDSNGYCDDCVQSGAAHEHTEEQDDYSQLCYECMGYFSDTLSECPNCHAPFHDPHSYHIAPDWTPTTEGVEKLPAPLRAYIQHLESENIFLKSQVKALQLSLVYTHNNTETYEDDLALADVKRRTREECLRYVDDMSHLPYTSQNLAGSTRARGSAAHPDHLRICAGPECGNPLPATARSSTLYCSRACRYRAYRVRKTPRPTCRQCHQPCPIGRSVFCSDDCYQQDKLDRRRKFYIYFDCKYCGRPLPAPRRADRKYCDDECLYLWHDEHRAPGSREWRLQPHFTHCQLSSCGKLLPRKRNANRKYCDNNCKKHHYRQQLVSGITITA